MADKKPSFTKVSEVTVTRIVESAKNNAQGQRKATNNAGKAWATTVLWLNEKLPLADYDDGQELKDIASDVRDTFKANFLVERADELGEIDDESEGKNARTGKLMVILDKDGQPKWSSWEETKLPIAYCGDIARIIKAGIVDEVLPGGNKVMGRTDALQRAKTPESPLETIERSAKLIGDKAKELGSSDIETAKAFVANAMKALAELNELDKAA